MAVVEDIPRLRELEMLFDNAMNEDMLVRELEVGQGLVYVEDGIIRGYALVRLDTGLLDLTRLGVEGRVQGKGIGGALLRRVYSDAGALGRNTMLTVMRSNHGALRLYLRHGFAPVGLVTGGAASESPSGAWLLVRAWEPAECPMPSEGS